MIWLLTWQENIKNKVMKILLLGEYSGFFTNLKKGLVNLGNDVTLASTGDGWKKINTYDYLLYKTGDKNLIKAAKNALLAPVINRKDLYGYDVVQMVSPHIYPHYINKFMLDRIIDNSQKSFLSVAGSCATLYKAYADGKIGYYTYDDNPEAYQRFLGKTLKSRCIINQENYICNKVDGIIPIMYEYAVGVRDRENFRRTIPLPMDTSSIKYSPNIRKGRIKIAHGLLKEKYKGTDYILKALEIIKSKYPNDVEVMVDGRMPLNTYLKWLSNANILIDQCKEHCYGLNAMYAMSMGRIVLGGASRNSLKEFGLSKTPVFHIKPDVNQIVEQLENVISLSDSFEQMGYDSRKYVEEFHNCDRIAKEYLDTWSY